MKTRLALFVSALLLLPFAGLLLSGGDWSELDTTTDLHANSSPLIVVILTLLALLWLANRMLAARSGNTPLTVQRNYFSAMALAGSVLGWLLLYLNHYVATWLSFAEFDLVSAVLLTLVFAILTPAVLLTRAWLGSFPSLLKRFAHLHTLPVPRNDTATFVLLAWVLLLLMSCTAWPTYITGMLWFAPLFLLFVLQMLWGESTILAGVPHGDWGRVACTALAGIIIGNLALGAFLLSGGELQHIPGLSFVQLGFALFGLTCLQLGDVIAEAWRGKTRAEVFKKKSFPIPVVVKK
ncbi:MAG: hypothetical protein FD121_997 [Gallionellaceae bacterium]|nr:MAG: hypothetical protein FD121_997 [Gallionellaceae bacterium]